MLSFVFFIFFGRQTRVSSQVRIDDKSSGNAKQKNLKKNPLLAPAVLTAGTVVGVTCSLSVTVNLDRQWI